MKAERDLTHQAGDRNRGRDGHVQRRLIEAASIQPTQHLGMRTENGGMRADEEK